LRTFEKYLNNQQDEITRTRLHAEEIDEHAKNARTLQTQLFQQQTEHRNLQVWNWLRKKELAKAIERTEGDYQAALYYFQQNYHIKLDEAPTKIRQIREKAIHMEIDLNGKKRKLSDLEWKVESKRKAYIKRHKFMIKKWAVQEVRVAPEPIFSSYRQNVSELMRDIRVEAKEEKRRNKAKARLREIKPKEMFVITPSEQKQRTPFDIGKTSKKSEWES
jgi:hypothetical protein